MTKANSAPLGAERREDVQSDWKANFLDALAQTSNVAGAARKAKIDKSTVYKTRRADPQFAREWMVALCDGYDNLEMELLARLRAGESTNAKQPRKYENATAFRLLIAHRESAARQRALRDHDDEETVLASINAKLDAMRIREKAVTDLLAEDIVATAKDAHGAG